MINIFVGTGPEAQMIKLILIFSDSRGRGLIDQINSSELVPQSVKTREFCIGGANLETLYSNLRRATRDEIKKYAAKDILIIFSGGICDLTSKQRTLAGQEIIYQRSTHKIASIKRSFRDIVRYTETRGFNLVISTVIPVSLRKANDFFISTGKLDPGKYEQPDTQVQAILDEDLAVINAYILDLAENTNIKVTNFHKELVYKSVKRLGSGRSRPYTKTTSKTKYNHLFDGVHADSTLKRTLFKKVEEACGRIISRGSRRN